MSKNKSFTSPSVDIVISSHVLIFSWCYHGSLLEIRVKPEREREISHWNLETFCIELSCLAVGILVVLRAVIPDVLLVRFPGPYIRLCSCLCRVQMPVRQKTYFLLPGHCFLYLLSLANLLPSKFSCKCHGDHIFIVCLSVVSLDTLHPILILHTSGDEVLYHFFFLLVFIMAHIFLIR